MKLWIMSDRIESHIKSQANLIDYLFSHKFVMLWSPVYLIWQWPELQKEQGRHSKSRIEKDLALQSIDY